MAGMKFLCTGQKRFRGYHNGIEPWNGTCLGVPHGWGENIKEAIIVSQAIDRGPRAD